MPHRLLTCLWVLITTLAYSQTYINVTQGLPTEKEKELYRLIMDYRARYGLPAIPLSTSLTKVAQTHVRDLQLNYTPNSECNLHSWSDNGAWSSCCYTDDHRAAQYMWNKPRELTSYKGNGYEIACGGTYVLGAEDALESWQGSFAHNQVILNQDIWAHHPWQAIGCGIYGSYAVVWFGEEVDKAATTTTIVVPREDYVSTMDESVPANESTVQPGTSDYTMQPQRESVSQRFYAHSGRFALWYFHAGYTYNIPSKWHNLDLSLLDFRIGWWGLSPLSFEAVVPQDYEKHESGLPIVSYMPSTHLFIPCTSWLSIGPMVGVAVDLSYFNHFFKKDCEFDYERDFYLTGRAGVSIFLTPVATMPIELCGEYRFPFITPESGDYLEKGFYVSCHLYLGSHWN